MLNDGFPIVTRRALPGDRQTLLQIWAAVFGDLDAEIEAFFEHYYESGICVVAAVDNTVVAAGYSLPFGNLICKKKRLSCAMIYSVATLPSYRKFGCGTAIVRELLSESQAAGFDAVVLCPAGDSLFEYYSSRAGMRDWFYVDERTITNPSSSGSPVSLAAASVEEYALLRAELLSDRPHIELDARALSYQLHLCRSSGGGLFRAFSPDGSACLIIEGSADGVLNIKELLTSNLSDSDVIAAVSELFPVKGYFIRSPSQESSAPSTRRFGMLALSDGVSIGADELNSFLPWYGSAFD